MGIDEVGIDKVGIDEVGRYLCMYVASFVAIFINYLPGEVLGSRLPAADCD